MFTEQEIETLKTVSFDKVFFNVCKNETLHNGTFIFVQGDRYTVSYHENELNYRKWFTRFPNVVEYITHLIKSQ